MMFRYDDAKDFYGAYGVDPDRALQTLAKVRISMQCWQGDDICGFEGGKALSGGIAVTGNYPGKARNPGELMGDIEKALSLIPAKHRLNLHASYAVTDQKVDRDRLEPEHFAPWLEFAKKNDLYLDFNPTFFSHPKAASNLTLSSPDPGIRDFWIEHGKAARRIAYYFGKTLNSPTINNIWIPDGYKDIPADRYTPRERLKNALDIIFRETYDRAFLLDSIESKVFGLGLESYTVGSHEFCMHYAAHQHILYLLDAGHFHPTEVISDKIPSLLLFTDKLALHVSRPVRWDSDHVVIFDDELKEIAKELVRCSALDRVFIGMDFFDASINRIAAWVCGMRNMQKALLYALLLPYQKLAELQYSGQFTELMALSEEFKLFPFGIVWDRFCEIHNVPLRDTWLQSVQEYERQVLSKR
jgi:L-rhamnose isomerase